MWIEKRAVEIVDNSKAVVLSIDCLGQYTDLAEHGVNVERVVNGRKITESISDFRIIDRFLQQ